MEDSFVPIFGSAAFVLVSCSMGVSASPKTFLLNLKHASWQPARAVHVHKYLYIIVPLIHWLEAMCRLLCWIPAVLFWLPRYGYFGNKRMATGGSGGGCWTNRTVSGSSCEKVSTIHLRSQLLCWKIFLTVGNTRWRLLKLGSLKIKSYYNIIGAEKGSHAYLTTSFL